MPNAFTHPAILIIPNATRLRYEGAVWPDRWRKFVLARYGWRVAAAFISFLCMAIGIIEIYNIWNYSWDWHGPAWVLAGLGWLCIACCKPIDET
jgi:hypothetical protein